MTKLWMPSATLHLPPPRPFEFGNTGLIGGTIELGAWDRRHRLIQQFREPCRSPIKQFLQILLTQMGAKTITITTVANVGKSVAGQTSNAAVFDSTSTVFVDTHGVVVGTGTTAVDITDIKLVTQIADGNLAGELLYNADVYDNDVTVADPNCTFVAYRNFNNNSGGSITVGETGIYGQAGTATAGIFLLFRDVPTALVVPDGGGCYVKYTFKISE